MEQLTMAPIEDTNPLKKVSISNFATLRPEAVQKTINGVNFNINPVIPYEDLLSHIQWALFLITDDHGYISYPIKIMTEELIMCAAFTDLDLRRLETAGLAASEMYEMYDILKVSGIIDMIKDIVDVDQQKFYHYTLDKTIDSILNYRNSVAGMVELLAAQSDELKTKLSDTMLDFNDESKVGNLIKIADLLQSKK